MRIRFLFINLCRWDLMLIILPWLLESVFSKLPLFRNNLINDRVCLRVLGWDNRWHDLHTFQCLQASATRPTKQATSHFTQNWLEENFIRQMLQTQLCGCCWIGNWGILFDNKLSCLYENTKKLYYVYWYYYVY